MIDGEVTMKSAIPKIKTGGTDEEAMDDRPETDELSSGVSKKRGLAVFLVMFVVLFLAFRRVFNDK